MKFKKQAGLTAVIILLFVLAACQPQAVEVPVEVEVTRVVTETVIEDGTEVEVTRLVTETEQVIVTATPQPEAPLTSGAPNPGTYTWLTIGDIDTLDPNLAYDTASGNVLQNVLETLIYYNGDDPTTFVPSLATEVPSLENGLISEDGLTYTFNIREGVTFHEGGNLTASDVAYTFQRGLLQSDVNGPQWLLLEPIMGYASGDVTEIIADGAYAGDPDALVAEADSAALVAVCEEVQSRIVADDEAGTVTFNLAQPWGPFLSTIAASWGSILDAEWVIEQGGWDGSCETWQEYYSPGSENSELTSIINGTGPYMLDYWIPGEEYVLVANENYWRGDDQPVWEGGPAGAPRIETVIVRIVNEWGTRFAALQAGDAEQVTVPTQNETQVDPFVSEICQYGSDSCESVDGVQGNLRKYEGLPSVSRTDVFLTFDVATDDSGSNPYIGSGQLDGNGIRADFFSDINARRAMAYCFDYDTYITEVQNGRGVRNNGPIIRDMLGYNEDGSMYEYDPEQCAAEFEQAWGGVLPDTGFRFQLAFNTGSVTRQTIAEIYQGELSAVNPNYQVDTIGLPWPTFLRAQRASQLPVFVTGWLEDIHDPHNWVTPYAVGTYAGRQNLAPELLDEFSAIATEAVLAADPVERQQLYFDLQQRYFEEVPTVILSQQAGVRYEQPWVQDWFFRVGQSGGYYYAYGLATE